MPGVRRETLERVPAGVSALVAASLNPARPGGAARTDDLPVTLLDFGRERVGNVVDVTLFALPTPDARPSAPPVVLVVRSNDVERSRRLADMLLGLASPAGPAGGPAWGPAGGAEPLERAGLAAHRHPVPGAEGFSLVRGAELWLAADRGVLERSLSARDAGSSFLTDAVYAERVRALTGAETMLVLAHPGRVAETLLPLADPGDTEPMRIVAHLARETVLSVALQHSATALELSLRLSGIPDVGEFVQRAIATERGDEVSAR
jgi:hypothetical protein